MWEWGHNSENKISKHLPCPLKKCMNFLQAICNKLQKHSDNKYFCSSTNQCRLTPRLGIVLSTFFSFSLLANYLYVLCVKGVRQAVNLCHLKKFYHSDIFSIVFGNGNFSGYYYLMLAFVMRIISLWLGRFEFKYWFKY